MARTNQLEDFFEDLGSNFVGNLENMLLDNIQSYLQSNGVSPMILCGGIQHNVKPPNRRKTGETPKGYKSPVTSRSKSPQKTSRDRDRDRDSSDSNDNIIELKETSEGVWQ